MGLKPPQNMRLPSKGQSSGSAFTIEAMRGSFITFAFTRSRALRDLKTIHENTTLNIKTQTAPTVGTAVALSTDVDTDTLEAGATLFVEGDGSATVAANGGVVLAASAAGRGFIVSEGTITFTPGATATGATDWELWYWPLDDGAAIA